MCLYVVQDGIVLDVIFGFCSYVYQLGIFEWKLVCGLSVMEILKVNVVLGFSEYYSGYVLDIGMLGDVLVEELFEVIDVFVWLQVYVVGYGFWLSYLCDNLYGIVYELWYWCWKLVNG